MNSPKNSTSRKFKLLDRPWKFSWKDFNAAENHRHHSTFPSKIWDSCCPRRTRHCWQEWVARWQQAMWQRSWVHQVRAKRSSSALWWTRLTRAGNEQAHCAWMAWRHRCRTSSRRWDTCRKKMWCIANWQCGRTFVTLLMCDFLLRGLKKNEETTVKGKASFIHQARVIMQRMTLWHVTLLTLLTFRWIWHWHFYS